MRLPANEWLEKREKLKKIYENSIRENAMKTGIYYAAIDLKWVGELLQQTESMTIEELRKEFENLTPPKYIEKLKNNEYKEQFIQYEWCGFLLCARHFGMVNE